MDEFTDPASIEDLRAQIAAMRDDRARGELLDTLWQALAAHGRWDEALTSSAQLLEVQRALTERDPAWETRLASTLFKYATLLRSHGRVAEAVDAHVQAHRIRQRHIADSAEGAIAYARNAEALAAALAGLHIAAEVREILPKAIAAADVHLVVSETALSRAWCCYELAVFNKRPVPASAFPGGKWHGISVEGLDSMLARPLRSVIAQRQTLAYRGFDATATTVTTDKAEIERYLRDEFPEGLDGVNQLLLQVGLVSDTFVTPGFALYPAAEDAIRSAADKWLAR